jgi:hypothetical protein
MSVSEEDVQKKAESVQKLREQVQDAEANRVSREAELSNQFTMTQLEAEEAQLKARLTVAKEAGKVSVVKQGADAPMSAVKAQMEQAVAQEKAAAAASKASQEEGQVPTSVDTTPEPPKE